MKLVFALLLLLNINTLTAQSVYVTAGNEDFRLYTEFRAANGFYQVVQNEKGEVQEVNLGERGLFKSRNYKQIYHYSYAAKQHVYSEDMSTHFGFNVFGKLDEIGGKSVSTWFHAPDSGPFILNEIQRVSFRIDLYSKIIKEIEGLDTEYDMATGRITKIGDNELDYFMGEHYVIKE